ncbi:2OG-Fe(II) oxygenase family protein [Sandarakinorhabdus sp.]|uniref:2OG-Fe(II) oxygenase n=1 Tax=Sandarakinorhabdus sp. TaxID=1916663 RepID=UPI00286E170F|nr:2OG-Fe(II) oxygenase family protein [Sandarakinorhabdus sp.]
MIDTEPLLVLNPALDRAALAAEFARDGRVQIRDVLTAESAAAVLELLSQQTPWGLSWQAGTDGPHKLRQPAAAALNSADWQYIYGKLGAAQAQGVFAFIYSQYQAYDAHREGWSAGPQHDRLYTDINSPEILGMVREVTALPQIVWADTQATLFGPQQFLSLHQDISDQGWLVAYVFSFAAQEWSPDWGGYLNFYDDDGDIIRGYRPRFNSLNMFRVPRDHSVSFVPGFAPPDRFALTGWFRDRQL